MKHETLRRERKDDRATRKSVVLGRRGKSLRREAHVAEVLCARLQRML